MVAVQAKEEDLWNILEYNPPSAWLMLIKVWSKVYSLNAMWSFLLKHCDVCYAEGTLLLIVKYGKQGM